MNDSTQRYGQADLLGMANSMLCLVHCLAMPLLISLGTGFLGHPMVELLFITLSAWAVQGAVRNAQNRMKIVLWSLWAVFAGALVLEHFSHAFEWIGLAASAGLVLGHAMNYRDRSKRSAIALDT